MSAIIAFLGCGIALAGCEGTQDDVRFARRVTAYLLKGWYLARPMIEWSSLKMLERDIGAEYGRFASAEDKAGYERSFIDGFKEGFKKGGGRQQAFFNWRVFDVLDDGTTVVAANCFDKSKVMLFYVRHEKGTRKLVEVKAIHGRL